MRWMLLALAAACDGDSPPEPVQSPPPAPTTPPPTTPPTTPPPPPELWAWCPSPDTAVSEPGQDGRLDVAESAIFCSAPVDYLSLEEILADKVQLRVVPGSYAVPLDFGYHSLNLPVCAVFPDGAGLATRPGGHLAGAEPSSWDGTDFVHVRTVLPLDGDAVGPWSLSLTIGLDTPAGTPFAPLVVDGSPPDPFLQLGFTPTLHANADGLWGEGSRLLNTCGSNDWGAGRHEVTFDGGEVALDVQIGESVASTEPSAFVRASGTLDGVDFEVTDFWRLVYQPEHHHFTRHFAVVLDPPIGEACALRIEGLEPGGDSTGASVSLAACDLEPLAPRAVTSDTHTGR